MTESDDVQASLDYDDFVLVLVDGDGYIVSASTSKLICYRNLISN